VVPNVVHLKLVKAQRRLIKRHCRAGKITRKHSTRANRGRVLKQSPKASRRKRRNGFKVALTVGN
jgi:beta-lactam-binding protein with PASTA domain